MVSDSISPYFEPLTDVVYVPPRAIAKVLGMGEMMAILLFTFQMGFLLSFGFNFLTRPTHRKLYSTLTGLFLGFYIHGLGYFVIIFQFSCFYPFLWVLPRNQASKVAVAMTGAIMCLKNFLFFWESILDLSLRV